MGNELEERAEELDKKRTHTISSVSLINDRNRKANVNKAEAAIRMEIKKKAEGGFEENPFQRKRSAPRLVTKSNVAAASAAIVAASSAANSNKSSANDKSAEQKENLVKVTDTSIVMKRKTDEESKEESGKDEPKAKKMKAKLGSGLPLSMQKEDLFDAHNFDIEIDVDTNLISIPNPGAAGAMAPPISLKPTSSERAPV